MRACMRTHVYTCVHACVRMWERICACMHTFINDGMHAAIVCNWLTAGSTFIYFVLFC